LLFLFDCVRNRELVRGAAGSYTLGTRATKWGLGSVIPVTGNNIIYPALPVLKLPLSGVFLTNIIPYGGNFNFFYQFSAGVGLAFQEANYGYLRFTHGGIADYQTTTSIWDGTSYGDSQIMVVGFTNTGSLLTFYVNGKQFDSPFSVGAVNNANVDFSVLTTGVSAEVAYFAALFRRALSAREHFDYAMNPWAVYASEPI
jgi:uncharacterized protein YceK